MGIGGTQEVGGRHDHDDAGGALGLDRSDGGRIVYLGGAAGFVLRAPDMPTIYFAGDTGLFGDMKIIGEIYKPQIAFLPIGDHYTMGPDTAAIAAQVARRAPGRADALGHVPGADRHAGGAQGALAGHGD